MRLLWIIPFLLAAQEKPAHRRIVDLKITGQSSNACYEVVTRKLKESKVVDRVVYWVCKQDVRTHVVLKDGDLKLSDVTAALAAAKKEMKDSLRMEVDYKLDDAAIALPKGTKYTLDGKELETDKAMTLAELRKAAAALTDVVFPSENHPLVGFACPRGCSASAEATRCPSCNEEMLKVEAPAAEGG
jgi:hypothetical protein